MLATVLNCALIGIGSLMGILLRNRISTRFTSIIIQGLSLCVIIIGLSSALGTNNTLCLIICMVLGTILGEALNIKDRLDRFGIFLRKKLVRKKEGEGSQFTEGFVTASVLSVSAPWRLWAPSMPGSTTTTPCSFLKVSLTALVPLPLPLPWGLVSYFRAFLSSSIKGLLPF